ncbi:MerR family transcriptional regulator [Levilactobacillus sp. HBUAS70063]|uniref:MerR family transcriptional regulator n=1 Tax=Levilactobacillus sp. HBUAS70063 TaxID=3109359 RepID=UPI003132E817
MKINEAAKQLRTSAWTLRYYEQIGVIAPVTRVSGIRDYTPADIDQLREVLTLRDCGVKLAEIKQLLALEQTTNTADMRRQLLQTRATELRHEIDRLQTSLTHLDAKIATMAGPKHELVGNGSH